MHQIKSFFKFLNKFALIWIYLAFISYMEELFQPKPYKNITDIIDR